MVHRSIANWLTFCSGGESNAGRESEQYEKQRRHIHAQHTWHTCFRGRSGLRILRCTGREPICWNFSRRSILGTGSPYMFAGLATRSCDLTSDRAQLLAVVSQYDTSSVTNRAVVAPAHRRHPFVPEPGAAKEAGSFENGGLSQKSLALRTADSL